jgi:hypothetical protein
MMSCDIKNVKTWSTHWPVITVATKNATVMRIKGTSHATSPDNAFEIKSLRRFTGKECIIAKDDSEFR